jgi:hypothetical protein
MSKKFLSYDSATGLLTTSAVEDGKMHIGYEQDVSGSLDFAERLRNERLVDKLDSDHSLNHVAFIPDSVILKMKFEDGVNFYDKAQAKRVLQLIETKYPKCKTTYKRIA